MLITSGGRGRSKASCPQNGWGACAVIPSALGCGQGTTRTCPPNRTTNPGADCAKELQQKSASDCPGNGVRRLGRLDCYTKRLSATDISALASMKNVAKCDTWCELQNPANHRVFERKLRPKPFGRGHVCLGVTHRCPNPKHLARGSSGTMGADIGLP